MTISERTETFFGKRVVDYSGGAATLEPGTVHRLTLDYDADRSIEELLREYLGQIDKGQLEALILGMWSEPHDNSPTDAFGVLIEHAAALPRLKALFIGDMTYEECEISWIIQGDYGPLLAAFPRLEVLRIRGSTSLTLPAFSHSGLRELAIECGGLPREIGEALAQSTLPALEHLELWLGADDYGFDGDVALFRSAVAQLKTPRLRYLGLRDSEIVDELAVWLAGEAWVAELETLDLSLGTLSDKGAAALLASPHAKALKRLDLSHHYISEGMQQQLREAIPGVVLDGAQEGDEDDRYVAVGE